MNGMHKTALTEGQLEAILGSIGPVFANNYSKQSNADVSTIDSEIEAWLDDDSSNLLILSGSYGSGKSFALEQLIGDYSTDGVYDFAIGGIPNAKSIPGKSTIFIDHFDEYTSQHAGESRAPDIRDITSLLKESKVCLITNRDIEDRSQEIFRQTRFISRQRALGIKNPRLVATLPWPSSKVAKVLEEYDTTLATHFGSICAGLHPDDLEEMLKPLVLRMLLAILHLHDPNWIPEYGEIFNDFLEHALSWDYDQGRSILNSSEKRVILADVARLVFLGPGLELGAGSRAPTISAKEIQKIIDARPSVKGQGKELLEDFLLTNHCIREFEADEDKTNRLFRFHSRTIFEYFLAHSLTYGIQSGVVLGIPPNSLNPAILDTRFLYFSRKFLPENLSDRANSLLSDDKTNHVDRLILLYLIEDRPGFIQYLEMAPEAYYEYLRLVTKTLEGHFIVKIAMFQLVSVGRMSASEYVDYVQNAEEPFHIDIELQICRSPRGNLDYLSERFRNPDLIQSAAISIYRIAQLDPSVAETLLDGQDFLSNSQLLECNEAIHQAHLSRERRSKLLS